MMERLRFAFDKKNPYSVVGDIEKLISITMIPFVWSFVMLPFILFLSDIVFYLETSTASGLIFIYRVFLPISWMITTFLWMMSLGIILPLLIVCNIRRTLVSQEEMNSFKANLPYQENLFSTKSILFISHVALVAMIIFALTNEFYYPIFNIYLSFLIYLYFITIFNIYLE